MPISDVESKFKELQDRLRRGLGNLTLAQLNEEQCRDCVSSAIKEFSKYRPIEVLDLLTTIAGQATYPLVSKERIISVKEVFYSVSREFVLDEYSFLSDENMLGRLEGISIFENPSIWTQYMQRLEQHKNIFEGDFDFDRSTKTLRLIPAPSMDGRKVYYVWRQRHTAATVPEDDSDTALLWAKGEAKEMLANKRGSDGIQSISGFGQSVTMGGGADSLRKEAEDYKDRFRRKFAGSTIIIG